MNVQAVYQSVILLVISAQLTFSPQLEILTFFGKIVITARWCVQGLVASARGLDIGFILELGMEIGPVRSIRGPPPYSPSLLCIHFRFRLQLPLPVTAEAHGNLRLSCLASLSN